MGPEVTAKRCPRCGETKEAAAFYQSQRNGTVELSGWCKQCQRDYAYNRYHQADSDQPTSRAHRLAVGRALRRLAVLHPREYRRLLNEELADG